MARKKGSATIGCHSGEAASRNYLSSMLRSQGLMSRFLVSDSVLPSSSKGSESAAPRKRSSSPEKLLVDSNHETGSSPLVGVDDHLSSAFEFFLAKRLMPSPSSFVREKPLLVTGPQGIGKTALAMEIARRLERDRRTTLRTIYVNCGEQPATSLQGIKDRFKSWVKDASHDGPSLLVLDGIDSFLRTEQEVSGPFRFGRKKYRG